MRLTSSTGTKNEGENLPVAIFCFEEHRKFIRVSEDYEDTVKSVRRAFGLPNDKVILFQTSTFEVCKGKETVIDESAYPLMWDVLEEIHVIIDEFGKVGASRVQEATRRDHVDVLPTPTDTPSNERHEDERDFVDRPPLNEAADGVEHDGPQEELIDEENVENPEDVAEEQEEVQELQETKLSKRMSDGRVASGSKTHNKFRPALTPNLASPPRDDDFTPQVKKEKLPEPGPSRIQAELTSTRTRVDASETPADDPRFEIVITSPDNTVAHFKTRGKHQVRKVLSAACKTFGLPYDRSHLVLVLAFEDDGQVQTHHFVCPPEDTMSKCGVDADSKLFIKVDEDGENGDSD